MTLDIGVFRDEQMLAQLSSWIKIILARHFFTRKTATTYTTVIVPRQHISHHKGYMPYNSVLSTVLYNMYTGYDLHGMSKAMENRRQVLKKCLKDGPSAVSFYKTQKR
jgi:hypothetical protein